MRACTACRRSLHGMMTYRRRGETFRPGSIMPMVPKANRGKRVLCMECYRELTPDAKRSYALPDNQKRGRFGGV